MKNIPEFNREQIVRLQERVQELEKLAEEVRVLKEWKEWAESAFEVIRQETNWRL